MTRKFQSIQLVIFIILYVIPFGIQLTYNDGKLFNKEYNWVVGQCNITMMVTATYFELIEFIQFYDSVKNMSFEHIRKSKGCCQKMKALSRFLMEFITTDYLLDFDNLIE